MGYGASMAIVLHWAHGVVVSHPFACGRPWVQSPVCPSKILCFATCVRLCSAVEKASSSNAFLVVRRHRLGKPSWRFAEPRRWKRASVLVAVARDQKESSLPRKVTGSIPGGVLSSGRYGPPAQLRRSWQLQGLSPADGESSPQPLFALAFLLGPSP